MTYFLMLGLHEFRGSTTTVALWSVPQSLRSLSSDCVCRPSRKQLRVGASRN